MPIQILMPALSPTMEEGTLAKWLVKEGDDVASGDVIAEIETDKATMEVEAVEEGTIGKILVEAGTEGVKVNETIAVLLEEGEDASAIDAAAAAPSPHPSRRASGPPQDEGEIVKEGLHGEGPSPSGMGVSNHQGPATAGTDTRIKASPLARRLAAQAGLDLAAIAGSGPNGRIIKADVEAASKGKVGLPPVTAAATAEVIPFSAPSATPQDLGIKPDTYDEVALDGMRKVVAKRMTESKQQVPHFPLTIDCEVDNLLAMRKELNTKADGAFKLSVNDFIIRAAALALKKSARHECELRRRQSPHASPCRYRCRRGRGRRPLHPDHLASRKQGFASDFRRDEGSRHPRPGPQTDAGRVSRRHLYHFQFGHVRHQRIFCHYQSTPWRHLGGGHRRATPRGQRWCAGHRHHHDLYTVRRSPCRRRRARCRVATSL